MSETCFFWFALSLVGFGMVLVARAESGKPVAKTIKPLDARLQLPAWESQMQPLLDKEAELDNPK